MYPADTLGIEVRILEVEFAVRCEDVFAEFEIDEQKALLESRRSVLDQREEEDAEEQDTNGGRQHAGTAEDVFLPPATRESFFDLGFC